MKNYLILLLFLPLLSWSQPTPGLFEVVNIHVKQGQEKAFETAVKAHNAQFHGAGPHAALLYSHINGPYGGGYQWVMGPTTWSAMDTRPSSAAHDTDWAKVLEFVESSEPPQYWSMDMNNSQMIQDPANTLSVIWLYDLKSGKEAQWSELVGKVKKVFAEKRPTEDFLVAWNAFSNAKGEDAVLIFTMDKWADINDQRNFATEFEAVHGPGSWTPFVNHVEECVKQRVDWIRTLVD